MIRRVAYLSLHTSPLETPGIGDAGGMNVYIDELARTMAGRGLDTVVFTRRTDPEAPAEVEVMDGYRVVNLDAGPPQHLPVAMLPVYVGTFADRVIDWMEQHEPFDLVHSHYWLSGWAGLLVKQQRGLPLANSFHTLGRVKDATRRKDDSPASLLRIAAEHEVIEASDCVIASTEDESDELIGRYGAHPAHLCVNPPGIDHTLFAPGDRRAARRLLGIPDDRPLLLFVGRIQPLKGVDVVVDAFPMVLERIPDANLMLVGGASGPNGSSEVEKIHNRIEELGIDDAVRFWTAQQHVRLPAFYQAADVVMVPSRSESFGLVAAEAQASGTPVVAARVGGLAEVVADGRSGLLVDGWEPADHAAAVLEILSDPGLADKLVAGAVEHAERFSWEATANRLMELYAGIADG
jgi:D-inositol-3-phosphate glycosyltransferase